VEKFKVGATLLFWLIGQYRLQGRYFFAQKKKKEGLMKRDIKGGKIKCKLDVQGVCPHCFKLLGDVYKVKENGQEVLMDSWTKYQCGCVDITLSEIEDLTKIVCKQCAREKIQAACA